MEEAEDLNKSRGTR